MNSPQELIKAPYEVKLNIGENAVRGIYYELHQLEVEKEYTTRFVIALTEMFVSCGHKFDELTCKYVNEVLGMNVSFEVFKVLFGDGAKEDFVNDKIEIIASSNEKVKKAIYMYGLSIMALDGQITKEGIELANRIAEIKFE